MLWKLLLAHDSGCPKPDVCKDGPRCSAGFQTATVYVVADRLQEAVRKFTASAVPEASWELRLAQQVAGDFVIAEVTDLPGI